MTSSGLFRLLLLLLVWLALTLHGAAHAALPVGWGKVDVLDKRLTIALPKGATPVVNGDAQPNRPGQRRISHGFEVEFGPVSVKVIVGETMARSADAIESIGQEYVRRLLPKDGDKPAVSLAAQKVNGVDVVTFSTAPAFKSHNGVLVKSAILRRPDNMLMRLDFYIPDEAAAQADKAVQAIDTVVSSIELGPRQLPTGKSITLADGELTLDLLPGYVAVEEERQAATVVNIMPIKRPGERRGTLSLYFGHDVRFCTPEIPAGTLRLFGRKGIWNDLSRQDWSERSVCLFDPVNPSAPQVKIRIEGADKQTEKELLTILKTVRSKSIR